MAGNSSLNGCSALNLNEVQELSFSCYLLIEAGMAVRYDGGKKTHKWCEGDKRKSRWNLHLFTEGN
jgi:hypothetical protein